MYKDESLRARKDERVVDSIIKVIRNLFRLKKGNEAIKGKIIRDIRNLFELEN